MASYKAQNLENQGTPGADPLADRFSQYVQLYMSTVDNHQEEATNKAMDEAEHAASLKPASAPPAKSTKPE